jgi:hypothetical protein
MPDNGFEQHLPTSGAVLGQRGELGHQPLELAIHFKEQLDRIHGWRERLSPGFRRAYSSGQLLFQFVGIAGYAGYFASMHTFMRIVSGALMAGAWYAIYRVRGSAPQ